VPAVRLQTSPPPCTSLSRSFKALSFVAQLPRCARVAARRRGRWRASGAHRAQRHRVVGHPRRYAYGCGRSADTESISASSTRQTASAARTRARSSAVLVPFGVMTHEIIMSKHPRNTALLASHFLEMRRMGRETITSRSVWQSVRSLSPASFLGEAQAMTGMRPRWRRARDGCARRTGFRPCARARLAVRDECGVRQDWFRKLARSSTSV